MADIEFSFEDNRAIIKRKMNGAIEATLAECAAELVTQTARNTRVATGQTKGSWKANIRKTSDGAEAVIGSELENALWEEFGTGEYALKGDGRKGGWRYKDVKGKWHHTYGKKPTRAFWHAYTMLKNVIIQRLQSKLKGEFK